MQSNTNNNYNNNKICSICLDNITFFNKTLQCKHEFHKSCIDGWLKNNTTCPMCRSQIIIVAPITKLPDTIIHVPININNNNNIHKTKIKKGISLFLYILLMLFHFCSCIYYFYESYKINNNINNYIKILNDTELGNHDHNTFSAEVLIIFDIVYYFFFIIINIIILKKISECCRYGFSFVLLALLCITNMIVHQAFYKNTTSYLNDDNLNFDTAYKNELAFAITLYGISIGSKIIVSMFTFLIWIG